MEELPCLQRGGLWDRRPTCRCLGLAPMRGSKQCGIDILPIFLLRFGSNLQMCMASLVIWEESLYFKYTAVQVCFKGVNTLKSLLMHPKDKVPTSQKKDIVYYWECHADSCSSSYIGETSRSLGERVKEHSKSSTSAILKHCTDFYHPLPSIKNFSIIDKDSSQVTWEAKEAIHIWRLDPNLNRNIGKMSIPHCFDPLIGAKPKHLQVGLLSQSPPPLCRQGSSSIPNTRPKSNLI